MDTSIFRDINSLAVTISWANPIFHFLAVYAVFILGPLTLATWWFARGASNPIPAVAASLWTAAGTLITVGLNQFIAHAVARPRPYYTLSQVNLLVPKAHDFSFPSDHATTSGAVLAGLIVVAALGTTANKKIAWIAAALAIAIAFSRVYVGAHYPGDVISGLIVGAAIVTLGWITLHKPLEVVVTKLSESRLLSNLIITRENESSRG